MEEDSIQEAVKEETADEKTVAQDSGKETLPETSEGENFAVFSTAALSVLAGVRLVARRRED